MKNHSLTQGSIAKGLLFFVIPLFFSNLFQQLYNTIDTLLVGHFLGDNALAAMGATAAIFELIVQFSNGCGTGFSIVTARYYGSKNEIIRAIKKLNELKLEVSEENLEACLDTAGMGDVDVLIRTSGEVRLSNYLLWQNAYAEMFFTKTYWPDFSQDELDKILKEFNKRERRFGGI